MTHTPGPWRVWEAGKESWEICEPSNPNRQSHFANVRVGNMWGEEGKANARLIASAPELLEALKDLVSAEEQYVEDAKAQLDDPISDAVESARAAIAKAEGRS